MIITCPECDTRFVVPSTIFMRGGRKLRCASCKHSWFQEEPLDRAVQQNRSVEDSEGTQSHAESIGDDTDQSFLDKIKNDFATGYKVIGGMCFLVVLSFFVYYMATPPLIVGQGLAFDNIVIERQDDSIIMTGNIVNAMDSARGVPSIQITKILFNDVEGDAIILAPEKNILQSGETLQLHAMIDGAGADVTNLKVTFKSSIDNENVISEAKDHDNIGH